jgi:excisionase family DNA binding protein
MSERRYLHLNAVAAQLHISETEVLYLVNQGKLKRRRYREGGRTMHRFLQADVDGYLAELRLAEQIDGTPVQPTPVPVPDPTIQPLLSAQHVADILGTSMSKVLELVRAGQLDAIRVGRHPMFPTALLARRLGLAPGDPPGGTDRLGPLSPTAWGLPDFIVEPAVIRRIAELVAIELRHILTTPGASALDGPDELLDTDGVARYCIPARATSTAGATPGTGPPCVKLGRRLCFRKSQVLDWIARGGPNAPPPPPTDQLPQRHRRRRSP